MINLNRSGFTGAGTDDCMLVEAGTQPNSGNIGTNAGDTALPGVAINPVTHQALLTASEGNQIALLDLPRKKVKQLDSAKVSSISSKIPDDPEGTAFVPANFPYGTIVDSCHNVGFVLEESRNFRAKVDLKKFKQDPAAISTPPAVGTCAGTTTQFQCSNGNGASRSCLAVLWGVPAVSSPSKVIRK